MKFVSRRVAAALLAAVLLVPVAPAAFAGPRDGDARDRIVRIIKKLQNLFGISTQSDPMPPRP